jgi:fatty acid CoA ligase FadD9
VAPATFYAPDTSHGRPLARYDGLTVDFLADSITAIGLATHEGHRTFNLASPHEDAISLDNFVDWMIEAGCAIERIDRYEDWLSRFETAMNALPEEQRNQSLINILGPYRHHQTAGTKSMLSADRFRAAADAVGLAIPHMSAAVIRKYVADLRHLKML